MWVRALFLQQWWKLARFTKSFHKGQCDVEGVSPEQSPAVHELRWRLLTVQHEAARLSSSASPQHPYCLSVDSTMCLGKFTPKLFDAGALKEYDASDKDAMLTIQNTEE